MSMKLLWRFCTKRGVNIDTQRIKKDQQGNLYYKDLLNFLDRTKCPMSDTIPMNVKYDLWWGSERDARAGTLINWCEFNKMLDLEKEFTEGAGNSIAALEQHH